MDKEMNSGSLDYKTEDVTSDWLGMMDIVDVTPSQERTAATSRNVPISILPPEGTTNKHIHAFTHQ